MNNVPSHLAAPAVGFVGAGLAMDDLVRSLQSLLDGLTNGAPADLAPELQRAVEITKAIGVLHHKAMLSGHTLATGLIKELADKQ